MKKRANALKLTAGVELAKAYAQPEPLLFELLCPRSRATHSGRYAKMRAMKTPLTLKGLTRWVSSCCALGGLLLLSVLTGELHAQGFDYTRTNGSITITNYTGSGGNVTIPATIDGMPVTAIGGKTFL